MEKKSSPKSLLLEYTNLNTGTDSSPLWHMDCTSAPFDFLYYTSPFPSILYLYFCLPWWKSAVTGWGREPFSSGKESTVKHPRNTPKRCWLRSWKPGTASSSHSIALTKDALSEEGILMTSGQPITTSLSKKSVQNILSSHSHLSHWLWRFCRLQQSNRIILTNENVMFHCWLPQSLKSILI